MRCTAERPNSFFRVLIKIYVDLRSCIDSVKTFSSLYRTLTSLHCCTDYTNESGWDYSLGIKRNRTWNFRFISFSLLLPFFRSPFVPLLLIVVSLDQRQLHFSFTFILKQRLLHPPDPQHFWVQLRFRQTFLFSEMIIAQKCLLALVYSWIRSPHFI